MPGLTDESIVIELLQCPCCSSDLSGMMTRVYRGVRWCHLCSFDVEEMPREEQDGLIREAREMADEGG